MTLDELNANVTRAILDAERTESLDDWEAVLEAERALFAWFVEHGVQGAEREIAARGVLLAEARVKELSG